MDNQCNCLYWFVIHWCRWQLWQALAQEKSRFCDPTWGWWWWLLWHSPLQRRNGKQIMAWRAFCMRDEIDWLPIYGFGNMSGSAMYRNIAIASLCRLFSRPQNKQQEQWRGLLGLCVFCDPHGSFVLCRRDFGFQTLRFYTGAFQALNMSRNAMFRNKATCLNADFVSKLWTYGVILTLKNVRNLLWIQAKREELQLSKHYR